MAGILAPPWRCGHFTRSLARSLCQKGDRLSRRLEPHYQIENLAPTAQLSHRALPANTSLSGKRTIDRWALPLLTLRVRHTWDHESPSRRSSLTRTASILTRGLPNRLPLARALRSPALTRSWMSDRSNSAMAPMIWNIRRPEGVERSRLSRKLTNATP